MLYLSFAVVVINTAHSKPSSRSLNLSSKRFVSMMKQGMERAASTIDTRCLQCICQKESSCKLNIGCRPSTNGQACGPYQLTQAYYQQCCSIMGLTNCDSASNWQACALDYNCATRCVTVRLCISRAIA